MIFVRITLSHLSENVTALYFTHLVYQIINYLSEELTKYINNSSLNMKM